MGALSLHYHWYIPRVYARFVTVLSIFHFSEKSLFYFYSVYFIIMVNNSNGNMYQSESDKDHVLHKFLYTNRGSIHVILSMCTGAVLSIMYYYISNHTIVRHYDQIIHDRILQHPVVQRYTHTTNTTRTTTTRYQNNNNNQNTNVHHRGAAPQLRQRYNTAVSTAAATVIDNSNNNNNENPWRIPSLPGGVVDDLNGGETDTNGVGMEHDGMTTIPLLPPDQVDAEAVEQLCTMGFERAQVVLALRQSHNNIEHAANRLLSSSTG
jgi:UBA/TS-N domain